MQTYIIFGNYTAEAMARVEDAPHEIALMRSMFKGYGVEFKEFYWTLGKYDFVLVAEARDEEALMRVLLYSARSGMVRTETVAAIPEARGAEVFKGLA